MSCWPAQKAATQQADAKALPPRSTPWSRLGASTRSDEIAVETICVIGAGSSGLVAAKHLRDAGYTVTILERTDALGGTFLHKAYDDSRLVSSKYLTSFSDLRPAPTDPSHISLAAYVEYLERYADQESLHPLITYGAHVAAVSKRADGKPGYSVRVEPVASTVGAAGAKVGVEGADGRSGRPRSKRASWSPSRGSDGGTSALGGSRAGPSPPAPDLNQPSPAHARLGSGRTLNFDAVCICSGLHEAPYVPPLAGMDRFEGELLHSAEYKDKAVFAGKRVLVVGCGETGMDLGYRAVQVAESCAMAIKRGFLSVPYEGWGGVPLDTLIANLFEHSYEHWWLHKHHIKWKVTSVFIRLGFFLTTGSSVGYNQYVGRVRDVKRGHHILCKSTAAVPYLNQPVKTKSWRRLVPWFWWNEPEVHKPIHSFGAPSSVEGKTVTFADGQTFDADMIVFATGYRQTFPFLHAGDQEAEGVEEQTTADGAGQPDKVAGPGQSKSAATRRGRSPGRRGAAAPAAADAAASDRPSSVQAASARGWVPCTGARGREDPLPSEHFIVAPEEPRLAFIGFVRPNVGAIPPMAEMQTFWWIERLRGRVQRGAFAPSYGLLGMKLNYGVDYGNYMHQLAAEIDASPTVSTLLRSPKAFIAYSLGQAYITFFRLQGPFASEAAWEVARTELFAPVVQRGVSANIIFLMTMAAFATMNLAAHAIEIAIGLVAPGWLARQRAAAAAAE